VIILKGYFASTSNYRKIEKENSRIHEDMNRIWEN